jgi:hypothetical protein
MDLGIAGRRQGRRWARDRWGTYEIRIGEEGKGIAGHITLTRTGKSERRTSLRRSLDYSRVTGKTARLRGVVEVAGRVRGLGGRNALYP